MNYLFLGNKTDLKSQKINQIKSKYLKNKEAQHFDYVSLYSDKLDKDTLKEALIDLPAVATKRVVVIHFIEKLKKDHQRIIEEFLKEKASATVLILNSDKADLKNVFVTRLKKTTEFFMCDSGAKRNVFDMTRDIEQSNPLGALKTLFELVADGEQPLRILGALLWFWGRMKNKVSRHCFQQGLLYLQEADLNIKRSRLNPVYSIEKCVVSLSALLH